MAAYRRVDGLKSPAGWLPVHRDQLQAQRSATSMRELFTVYKHACMHLSLCELQTCQLVQNVRQISFEKARNRRMTLKFTHGYRKWWSAVDHNDLLIAFHCKLRLYPACLHHFYNIISYYSVSQIQLYSRDHTIAPIWETICGLKANYLLHMANQCTNFEVFGFIHSIRG